MVQQSAGVLVWRGPPEDPQFLLVHPGGPYWRRRDLGAWSIPKGLVDPGESAEAAARREFREETGLELSGRLLALTPTSVRRGKIIVPWLIRADLDLTDFHSTTFALEWPPRAGVFIETPEVDAVAYFDLATALDKVLKAQRPILLEAASLILAG